MKQFFSPNIDGKGRLVRALWGVGMFVGAWFVRRISLALLILFVVSGALALFEALRGWCIVRACGIKTKL